MNVIISFGKFVDTGLATPFYNHDRGGDRNEPFFVNLINLHQEK